MDIGVVFQCDPPSAEVVDLAVKAEQAGFSHVWTFDSHLLWQEPFVIYSQILDRTSRVVVGPMVTNPGTRDWTVIASQFATLNEMYGNRTVCGIGRGDSALRTLGAKPGTIAEMKQCVHVVRELACGRPVSYRGRELQLKWADGGALEVWVAAYGPKALAGHRRGRRRVHPAARRPRHRGLDDRRGTTRGERRGTGPRGDQVLRRGPGVRRVRTRRTSGTRPAGSAAWSATTSRTSSPATATPARCRRR